MTYSSLHDGSEMINNACGWGFSETITRDKKEISISAYIKQQFENNSGWNNPQEQITKKAKEFGDEMKKRYDFFYANQIVQQMHTVGVIKEEIYANLIENKK